MYHGDMDLVSFTFGFITALVLMGVVLIIGAGWWFFSYTKHRQLQQKDPKKRKRPPYIVNTELL